MDLFHEGEVNTSEEIPLCPPLQKGEDTAKASFRTPKNIHTMRRLVTNIGLAAFLVAIGCNSRTQLNPSDAERTMKTGRPLNAEESRLYEMINTHRNANGQPGIPWSASLAYVAQRHVDDLNSHPPEGNCNLHSWSSSGPWSPCCYTPDHAQAQCMWNKPRELTAYTGDGFEIAHGNSPGFQATAESSLKAWEESEPHNAAILNRGIWHEKEWKAMGVAVSGRYAVAWFGMNKDRSR